MVTGIFPRGCCPEKYPIRDRAGWWCEGDDGRDTSLTAVGRREALKALNSNAGSTCCKRLVARLSLGPTESGRGSSASTGTAKKVYSINAEKLDGGDSVA